MDNGRLKEIEENAREMAARFPSNCATGELAAHVLELAAALRQLKPVYELSFENSLGGWDRRREAVR